MSAPPPLRPFGLVLRHDGRFEHEGVPVTHARLRAAFERSVRYLPDEGIFVVQLGRFRGWLDVEEAAFFVRRFDASSGRLELSDGSSEDLDPATLRESPLDGALLCAVKRELHNEASILARFDRPAQEALWLAVEETGDGAWGLTIGGRRRALPAWVDRA